MRSFQEGAVRSSASKNRKRESLDGLLCGRHSSIEHNSSNSVEIKANEDRERKHLLLRKQIATAANVQTRIIPMSVACKLKLKQDIHNFQQKQR